MKMLINKQTKFNKENSILSPQMMVPEILFLTKEGLRSVFWGSSFGELRKSTFIDFFFHFLVIFSLLLKYFLELQWQYYNSGVGCL